MAIKMMKDHDGCWTVWNTKTGEIASVVRIVEHGYFAPTKPRYRVDKDGVTQDTLIDSFQTAKGKAYALVR